MTIDLTEEESDMIEAALAIAHSAFWKTAKQSRNSAPRGAERCEREAAIAHGVRRKILVAKYGEAKVAEVEAAAAARRARFDELWEIYKREPANYGTLPPYFLGNGNAPKFAGKRGALP